jgi:hypothetical protein
MCVSLPNDMLRLVGIGHVERHRENGVAEALREIGDVC